MRAFLTGILLCFPLCAHAARPQDIVDHAPATAWRTVPADRLLVMTMGDGRRVLIELAPDFAPVHVANIVALARAGRWRGGAVIRVQDNYVVQWAPADEKAPLPAAVQPLPPAEYERAKGGLTVHPLGFPDPYAPLVGFAEGWPVGVEDGKLWLAHCYGMVGVARGMPPDTGNGEELYAVDGQAPRALDRNLAVVGRVVEGMDDLSALPRGTAALGFYAHHAQTIPLRNVTLAADLPSKVQPHVQVMDTDSPSFAEYLEARSLRTDAFFVHPVRGASLCNIGVPTRVLPPAH